MWPANIPELNPIKNLWCIHGKMLKDTEDRLSIISGLVNSLNEAWIKIGLQTMQNFVISMPDRVGAVRIAL